MTDLEFTIAVIFALLRDRFIQTLLWGCLGFGLLYGFRYAVRQNKELTTDELIAISPSFASIRWGHQLLGSLWTVIAAVGFIGFDWWYNSGKQMSSPVIGIVFASVAAFDGFFAARTGIYSVSDRWRFRYVYEYESDSRIKRLGRLQGFASLAVCFIGIVIAYVMPR